MGFLGKRISSVLLCGSMAFTIANSAGIAYAADDEQNVEEGAKQQSGDANEVEEEQGGENESGDEVEGNSAAQAVESSEGAEGEAAPSETGKGGGAGAAVAGGLAAGGLAAGVGIDRGISYLKGKSEANNNSVSVEEVKKEIERQVKEAYEKGLKEGENTASAADNAVYGALSGWIGEFIPGVDALVSKWFGKNLSRSSKAAIIAAIIIHVIGVIVAGTNFAGLVRNWDDSGKLKKGWQILKIGTGILVPPVGIALQLAEGIVKATWKEEAPQNVITDEQAVNQLMSGFAEYEPGTVEQPNQMAEGFPEAVQKHLLGKFADVHGIRFKDSQDHPIVLNNANLAFANT